MSAPYERRSGQQRLLDLHKIVVVLLRNKLIWIAPTIAFMVIGFMHAVTKKNEWTASQALIIRDEAISEMDFGRSPLGRFDSNDVLKRALEMILQVAKNPNLAKASLEEVGPERRSKKGFPNATHIEGLINDISVSAAKGTEFGTSEVVYLSVVANDPDRAIALTNAVCSQLESGMKKIRNQSAQSLIAELQEKKNLAVRQLTVATAALSKIEGELGSDLSEMRSLVQTGSSDSNLQRQVTQIKVELRQAETRVVTLAKLTALLQKIGQHPDAIMATPSQLLNAQPSLRRLRDGFVDAQLRTARLRGALTETHPQVRSAMLNEQNVKRQLLLEAQNAVRSSAADIQVSRELAASLKRRLGVVQSRLDLLATQRAGYENLTAEVAQCREQQRQASVALNEARGKLGAATASSLITRVDTPTTGSRPNGPGRSIILAGSSLGGLALGLSLVYLLAPWQEKQRAGRRQSDIFDRRATDHPRLSDRRTRGLLPPPRSSGQAMLQFQPIEKAVLALPSVTTNERDDDPLKHLTSIVKSKSE